MFDTQERLRWGNTRYTKAVLSTPARKTQPTHYHDIYLSHFNVKKVNILLIRNFTRQAEALHENWSNERDASPGPGLNSMRGPICLQGRATRIAPTSINIQQRKISFFYWFHGLVANIRSPPSFKFTHAQ